MHNKHTTHYLITVKKLFQSSFKIILKKKANTVETKHNDIGYNDYLLLADIFVGYDRIPTARISTGVAIVCFQRHFFLRSRNSLFPLCIQVTKTKHELKRFSNIQ